MNALQKKPERLFYIDNLRIFLISLVVLHHLSITYGAPGGWYYNETQAAIPEIIPLAWFVATNQAFFMGMFFFISAYFVLPSLIRKGTSKYINDRLLRLGIPLLFFYFILSPLTVFILNRFIEGANVSLINYWLKAHGTGFGPLWFVEALLIFSLIYLCIQPMKFKISLKFPGTVKIILTAVVVGLLQFLIRIWLPVGWSMPFTNFQFPFFVQYIVLFTFGIIAYQNHWLYFISAKQGKQWFIFAQVLIFFGFPLLFFAGDAANLGTEPFMGGVTWQSLAYALWEQLVGFSLIIGLLGLSKKYVNHQGKFAKQLSASAYGVFIFHAPVIVGISALFLPWNIFPLIKFVVLAPLALVSAFLVAFVFKKLPLVKKIL